MAPSKFLLLAEGIRAIWEFGLGLVLRDRMKNMVPEGDGHPVMVIPGLAASDGSTVYLRDFLESIGYAPHSWGFGRNLGPKDGIDNFIDKLVLRVEEIYEEAGGQEVSIIGWSLGGIYAREIAKRAPDKVRQVITLGTPFKGAPDETNATRLYEILTKDESHKDPNVIAKIRVAPPVPFTSIYSKTDGVVHWTSSIETGKGKVENIEIEGASHLGLAHHPVSVCVIADRLKQTKKTWSPYTK